MSEVLKVEAAKEECRRERRWEDKKIDTADVISIQTE